jgi:hypothetical protein
LCVSCQRLAIPSKVFCASTMIEATFCFLAIPGSWPDRSSAAALSRCCRALASEMSGWPPKVSVFSAPAKRYFTAKSGSRWR